MTLAHIAPAPTLADLAARFAAVEAAVRQPKLELARNLWAEWQREKHRTGYTQHQFLSDFVALLSAQGVTKGVTSLYPYLYAGCAQAHGFTPKDVSAGEPIGKALDRLGLLPGDVRAHLAAGTLLAALQEHRAPTTTVRVTHETRDNLNDAVEFVREHPDLVNVEGLSEPEIRALPMRGWENAPPHMRLWWLKLGMGEVDPAAWDLRTVDPDNPAGRTLGKPLTFIEWGKQHAHSYVTGEPPKGVPHHAHHIRVGEREARPNDGGPEFVVFVEPHRHIPTPGGPVTAHSREYAVGHNADALARVLLYHAGELGRYQRYIRGES